MHTLTTDNGKEFAHRAQSSAALKADHYFAHPHSWWKRGANENMNGLISEFFLKKMSFERIMQTELKRATHLLNHRLRKCLNYKTPLKAFMAKLHSQEPTVTLRG